MATLGELLHYLNRSCGNHTPDPILAQQWAQRVYGSILERVNWPFLITEGLISTVNDITSDSVTVTSGSTTVTETTSDSKWTSAINGRKFRKKGRTEYYVISTYANSNPDTFVLDRNYEGSTATATSYEIWQNVYSIPSDARTIINIRRINSGFELVKVSSGDLDESFPDRPTLADPKYWAPLGRDTSNVQRVEVYPIPDAARGLVIRYIEETPTLSSAATTILPQVNLQLMLDGMLAEYWRWRTGHNPAGDEINKVSLCEGMFEKRLQEMVIREIGNFPQTKFRFKNRFRRTAERTPAITLPDD